MDSYKLDCREFHGIPDIHDMDDLTEKEKEEFFDMVCSGCKEDKACVRLQEEAGDVKDIISN